MRLQDMIPIEQVIDEHRQDLEFATVWDEHALAREVACAVVAWRGANEISQRELARRMGVSQPVIARLETGEHEPTMATLRKVAAVTSLAFDVRVTANALTVQTTPLAS